MYACAWVFCMLALCALVRQYIQVIALAKIIYYDSDADISSSFKNELPEDLPGWLPLLFWCMFQKDLHWVLRRRNRKENHTLLLCNLQLSIQQIVTLDFSPFVHYSYSCSAVTVSDALLWLCTFISHQLPDSFSTRVSIPHALSLLPSCKHYPPLPFPRVCHFPHPHSL